MGSSELAAAIVDCAEAGARVLNLSVELAGAASRGGHEALDEALAYTTRRGVLVVAATGNHATFAGSVITCNPWVIPVVGCTGTGAPLPQSNLGRSIGGRGLGAPGEGVLSLAPGDGTAVATGASVAVPFVAGTAALLWSLFPAAGAADIRRALTWPAGRRAGVVPPLLNAWRSYQRLSSRFARKAM